MRPPLVVMACVQEAALAAQHAGVLPFTVSPLTFAGLMTADGAGHPVRSPSSPAREQHVDRTCEH